MSSEKRASLFDARDIAFVSCPPKSEASKLNLIVMKFSGATLDSAEKWQLVASIVRQHLKKRPVIVLSAIGKTTDELVNASKRALETGVVDIAAFETVHRELLEKLGVPEPPDLAKFFEELKRILMGVGMLKELSARTRDLIVSFGERICIRMFTAYLNHTKGSDSKLVDARAFDSWDVGMVTTSGTGSVTSMQSEVEVTSQTFSSIGAKFVELLGDGYLFMPVMTGYIAKDSNGVITTLGRHGSDQTAAIVGAAVGATEIQLWKDVGGIFTASQAVVPTAKPVRELTFEQMAELSAMSGTYFVHPAAVLPAWNARIPISMHNTMEPDDPGTTVVSDASTDKGGNRVTTISSKSGITMVVIRSTRMLGQHGFLAGVFELFNEYGISVDVITTSEVSISLTIDPGAKPERFPDLCEKLREFATVEVSESLSMLMLVRAKAKAASVLADCFASFEDLGVEPEMTSHGASDVNTTFILPDEQLERCIQKLHARFFE